MAYIPTIDKHAEYGFAFDVPFMTGVADASRTFQLTENDREAVLLFLNERPVHNVAMASFIYDNGIESKLNRGTFYGFNDRCGNLEGVALIGHTTLLEARSLDALYAFAQTAKRKAAEIHLILSSDDAALELWNMAFGLSAKPRSINREALFETSFPFPVQACDYDVRLARAEEISEIAEAHAEVTFIESGTDPLMQDPKGFVSRIERRIEQGRVFVAYDGDKLLFKADVVSMSANVAYLEGVYVAEDSRGNGIGPQCLAEVTRKLLGIVDSVCLLSNVDFHGAHRSFEKAGFKRSGHCTAVFA